MIRILVVSHIRLYRDGLAEFLVRDGRLRVAGTSGEAGDALDQLGELSADVVLMDMGIPNALTSIRTIANSFPQTKIIALGVSEKADTVVACAEAGVASYVCREGSLDELIHAVESAVRGELVCPPRVAAALLGRVGRLAARAADGGLHLTPRQTEVAELLGQGLMNQEIAGRLNIEVSTVKIHVHNIFDKLGVHSRGQAVAKLSHLGLLPLTALLPASRR